VKTLEGQKGPQKLIPRKKKSVQGTGSAQFEKGSIEMSQSNKKKRLKAYRGKVRNEWTSCWKRFIVNEKNLETGWNRTKKGYARLEKNTGDGVGGEDVGSTVDHRKLSG